MTIIYGILLAVFAGTINGLFALPMKLNKDWAWENTWLPFSILSLLVFPWLNVVFTVPELKEVLLNISVTTYLFVFTWGILVYIGSLCFGISLKYIPMSLSFSLLVGSMSIVGILLPVLIFNFETLSLSGGRWILTGILLLILSLIFSFYAGRLKDRIQYKANASGSEKKPFSSTFGMTLAIIGGVLSGFLSLGMSISRIVEIKTLTIEAGKADASNAGNIALALLLTGGVLPNALYCIYLLKKAKTFSLYKSHGKPNYWLIVIVMAVMYSGSVVLWGISSSEKMMGKLGNSVGWALFIGMIVISSNISGYISGEWKTAKGKPIRMMILGLMIILSGMICIGYGNYLLINSSL